MTTTTIMYVTFCCAIYSSQFYVSGSLESPYGSSETEILENKIIYSIKTPKMTKAIRILIRYTDDLPKEL